MHGAECPLIDLCPHSLCCLGCSGELHCTTKIVNTFGEYALHALCVGQQLTPSGATLSGSHDITLLPLQGLLSPAFIEEQRRRNTSIVFPGTHLVKEGSIGQVEGGFSLQQFFDANVDHQELFYFGEKHEVSIHPCFVWSMPLRGAAPLLLTPWRFVHVGRSPATVTGDDDENLGEFLYYPLGFMNRVSGCDG